MLNYYTLKNCIINIFQSKNLSFIQADSATRIGTTGVGVMYASETLDHFVVYGKTPLVHAVRVYDTSVDSISDHRPVEAILEF